MKRKDRIGRTWNNNDAEGTWEHGEHVIGCGGKNGSKFSIWAGPDKGHWEYKRLSEAMDACRTTGKHNEK